MPGGTFSYNTDKTVNDDTDFYPDSATFIEASDVMGLSDVCLIWPQSLILFPSRWNTQRMEGNNIKRDG